MQQYLGGIGTLIEDKSLIDADVAIVVGPDFGTVAAPGASGSGGAKPTTTTKRPAGGTTPSAPAIPAC